jgi:hypothetical protein
VARATKAAKTTKATRAPKSAVQHTWRVSRRNNQTIDVTAEALSAVYGDLVFSTKGVVVRVIGVDTYNDVELVSHLAP